MSRINWRSRGNKYGARKVKLDAYTFDSLGESRRYQELKLLEKQGLISALTIHPHYDLKVAGQKICTYVADFAYRDEGNNRRVEDFKGVLTPVFKIKWKLFEALFDIKIEIVTAAKRKKG